MSGNIGYQILRGSETYDPSTSEEVLLDGQLFYSKKTKELYVGDGESTLSLLKGTQIGLSFENGEGGGVEKVEQTVISTDDKGENIITITLTNGEEYTFTVLNGSKGSQGERGADGYTPVKYKDYFTEADISEMVQSVISALPKYNGEVIEI